MRRIPDKIRHGDTPSRVPRAVNDIIDYLRQTVPVPGTGIRISETINGNVFDADRPPQTVGGSGGSGGEVALGVLVSGPSNGYGAAVWRAITVNPDGTWTAAGEEVPVIVPLLK